MIRLVRIGLMAATLGFAGNAVAQSLPRWIDTVLPETRGLAMGGSDPSALIARREGLDPVRSLDGGRTWIAFNVLGTRPDRFVASPTDARVFYALVGGVAVNWYTGRTPSALYRTADAGASWELLASPFLSPSGAILGDIVVGADPDLVYASRMEPLDCMIGCVYEGAEAFVSSDGGRSWRSIDAGLGAVSGRILYPSASDARVVYATTRAGIFRSRDQGATWRLVRAAPSGESVYQRQLLVDRLDASIVYVRPTNGTELWVSEDGGDSWRTSPRPNVPGVSKRLVADPSQRGRLFFVGYEGEIFESRDRANSWQRVAPSSGFSVLGSSWDRRDTHPAVGIDGSTRVFIAPTGSTVRRIKIESDALALGSDLWWNPSESGAGFTITQHASGQVFVVWYSYDAEGSPIWYVVSGGTWIDPRTFSGTLHETRGPAYFREAFDPGRVTVTAIGTASLRFVDDSNAVFSYRFNNGALGTKAITRQQFGPPNDWVLPGQADLWWNANESGWGLVLNQQFGKVFATWFVYDAAGRPQWVVMPDSSYGTETVDRYVRHRFYGDIYTTRGPPSSGPFDPSLVTVTKVGTASVVFNGRDETLLTYSAFGKTETRALTRQPF